MEFFDWSTLITYTGALAMVLGITQLTKEIKYINKIPTQIWSYLISLIILYPAYYFTDQLSISNAVLIAFNAVFLALSANGGFEAIKNTIDKILQKKNN